MANQSVRKVADLDADKARYKLQGFHGTAATNSTSNIDWKLPEDRWVSGGIFLAQGTHWGDKIAVQVIDIDNVLGLGANVVLDEYVTDFYLVSDSELQINLESPYIALVPANIYIRVRYTNTSLIDPVELALNLATHIPRS